MPRSRPSDRRTSGAHAGRLSSTPQRRRSSLNGQHLGNGLPVPKMAVLAAANRIRDATGTPGRLLSGSGGPPAPLVVESQRYEEWMKIATDNKITSTNTWNLALIDYFHDMSLLRNGDDNSINFQKASCTLDGCVKIWTSRVDSVANETGKLLSGLGEGATQAEDDDMNDDEDGDDEEREQKKARKRAARSTPTLADSFSKLRLKAFDLEFTVDPLFKKTSADFDEGGAAGLLMNHLSVDGGMRVVFDAGDARLEMDEEDVGEEEREREVERRRREEEEEGEKDVNVVELFKCFSTHIPPSQPLSSRPAPSSPTEALDRLTSMSLCPSLSTFRFSADSLQSLNLGILNLDLNDDDDYPLPSSKLAASVAAKSDGGVNAHLADDDHDDFGGFDAGGQGFGGGFDDDEGAGGGGMEVDFFADEFTTPQAAFEAGLELPTPPAHLVAQHAAGGGGGGGGFGMGQVEPFDPSRPEGLAFTMNNGGGGDGGERGPGGGEEGLLLEYFDSRLAKGKGWAGPEHWKMARRRGVVASKAEDAEDADHASTADGKEPKKKREKVAFSFDFTEPPPLSAKELFAAATPKSSITSSVAKSKRKVGAAGGAVGEEEDHTLPADYGFRSRVLLSLFLKPKMMLRMRRRHPLPLPGGGLDGEGVEGGGAEADVQFWAQAGMGGGGMGGGGEMGGIEGYGGGMDGGEEYGGGFDGPLDGPDDDFPPPFDTQWLASGDNDGDHDDEPFTRAQDEAEKELDDLAAASAGQVRRARPETVNYAKRAKRVDVKRLKDSIWRELEEVVLEVKEFPKELSYDPSQPPPPSAPAPRKSQPARPKSNAKQSTNHNKEAILPVLTQLRKQYPKDKMDEISTSYMFICLLHLANEKGLRIQMPELKKAVGELVEGDGEDGEEEVRKLVGGIEGLRVMREV
ncbi:hypothetical protein JCM11641_006519 [Rhodosporidiobolus odoratus]